MLVSRSVYLAGHLQSRDTDSTRTESKAHLLAILKLKIERAYIPTPHYFRSHTCVTPCSMKDANREQIRCGCDWRRRDRHLRGVSAFQAWSKERSGAGSWTDRRRNDLSVVRHSAYALLRQGKRGTGEEVVGSLQQLRGLPGRRRSVMWSGEVRIHDRS